MLVHQRNIHGTRRICIILIQPCEDDKNIIFLLTEEWSNGSVFRPTLVHAFAAVHASLAELIVTDKGHKSKTSLKTIVEFWIRAPGTFAGQANPTIEQRVLPVDVIDTAWVVPVLDVRTQTFVPAAGVWEVLENINKEKLTSLQGHESLTNVGVDSLLPVMYRMKRYSFKNVVSVGLVRTDPVALRKALTNSCLEATALATSLAERFPGDERLSGVSANGLLLQTYLGDIAEGSRATFEQVQEMWLIQTDIRDECQAFIAAELAACRRGN